VEPEGSYTVVIAGPQGEWRWAGYAGSRTDALYQAVTAVEEETRAVEEEIRAVEEENRRAGTR
jgi:hypothetical protein